MRKIVIATLLAAAVGCGTSQKAAQSSDPSFARRATAYPQQPPPPKPDSSLYVRSTESGPSGPAGVGR